MPPFHVTVRVQMPQADDGQVSEVLRAIPRSLFDPMRRELVQSSVVDAAGERSARDKAVRRVTWALDDAGMTFTEYTVVSSVSPSEGDLVPPDDPET